jgi:hypothetical protein
MKPSYIKLEATAPSFKWDRNVMWSSAAQDIRAEDQISGRWNRVKLALAVGMAKWIIYRDPVDKIFTDILTAVEASVVDRRYLNLVSEYGDRARRYWSINPLARLDEDLWDYERDLLNPQTGPKWVAITYLIQAADRTAPNDTNSTEVVSVSKLARQVLSKSEMKAFTAWRKAVMARFDDPATARFYYISADQLTVPEAEVNLLGPILPPEVVDPDFPFTPDKSEDLAHAFLQRLRPAENEFLVPGEDLLKLGLAQPYGVR